MPDGYISNSAARWFIALAIVIDIVVFLLGLTFVGNVVTPVVNIVAWLTFYMLFKQRGVHFNSTKRALSMGGGLLVELIPIVNLLPAWTAAVLLVLSTTKLPLALGGTGAKKPRPQDDEDETDDTSEDVEE